MSDKSKTLKKVKKNLNRGSLKKLRSSPTRTYPLPIIIKYSESIKDIDEWTKHNKNTLFAKNIKKLLDIYKKLYVDSILFNRLTLSERSITIIYIKKNIASAIKILHLLFKRIKNNSEYNMIIILYENILKILTALQKDINTYNKNKVNNYELNMTDIINSVYKMKEINIPPNYINKSNKNKLNIIPENNETQ